MISLIRQNTNLCSKHAIDSKDIGLQKIVPRGAYKPIMIWGMQTVVFIGFFTNLNVFTMLIQCVIGLHIAT